MTERKLTDEEKILSLLKVSDDVYANAKLTPEEAKTLLDLFNRQKAEIERLEREIEDLESAQEITPEAKHFIDTKADKVISLMNEIIKSQEQIKAEAIKDFAEVFTGRFIRLLDLDCQQAQIATELSNRIVKEMTGGTDFSGMFSNVKTLKVLPDIDILGNAEGAQE